MIITSLVPAGRLQAQELGMSVIVAEALLTAPDPPVALAALAVSLWPPPENLLNLH